MFNISSNNIISLERGDSGEFNVEINLGSAIDKDIYTMTDLDKLYFGVVESSERFENSLIRKVYTNKDVNEDGTITIKLNSEDTENLLSGVYYYEIKLEKGTYKERVNKSRYIVNDTYTIQPRRKFIIME